MSCKRENKNKKHILGLKYLFYDFVKVTAALPSLLFIRPRRYYESKEAKNKIKGGAIVIANHVEFLDPVKMHCVLWYRRLYFLAVKDLFATGLKKWFFSGVLCLPVDKENFSMDTFNRVVDAAKEGHVVCIYPEGQINREENRVGGFKSGVILMALKSKVPVVPIYCPKSRGIFHMNYAVIGEPVDIGKICGEIPNMEAVEKASEYLRNKEKQLIQIYKDRRKINDD